MLKTAIAGADAPVAGELIRLLVNHPEIDFHTACAPAHRGRRLCDVHYGLIGESDIRFSDSIDLANTDVLFICTDNSGLPDFHSLELAYPELRIIDVSPSRTFENVPYGLSEINRKEMVRGARSASVATAEAAAALIALYPAACNLLLPPGLSIIIETDLEPTPGRVKALTDEITTRLRITQSSFMTKPEIVFAKAPAPGIVAVTAEFASSLSVENALALYDAIYDDHNFTFLIPDRQLPPVEISGTNRCIVTISNPIPGRLCINALLDGQMRGGAAGALHIMNLLCGLHEKTGLALHSSGLRAPINHKS